MSFDPFADENAKGATGATTPTAAKKPSALRNALIYIGLLLVVGRVFIGVFDRLSGIEMYNQPANVWEFMLSRGAIIFMIAASTILGKFLMGSIGAIGYGIASAVITLSISRGTVYSFIRHRDIHSDMAYMVFCSGLLVCLVIAAAKDTPIPWLFIKVYCRTMAVALVGWPVTQLAQHQWLELIELALFSPAFFAGIYVLWRIGAIYIRI